MAEILLAAAQPSWGAAQEVAAAPYGAGFAGALASAREALAGAPGADLSNAMQGMRQALDQLDARADQIGALASSSLGTQAELSPGEMVVLTARAHEFMFMSQLVSNAANRISDGVQQLFKQQA